MKTLVMLWALMVLAATAPAFAQESKPPADVDTLKVQLTVSRYDGDKRVASVPLSLSVVTTGAASRVMAGTDIAVSTPSGGMTPEPAFSYKSVGTSVNASASRLGDGRYQLSLSVEANWG